MNQIFGHSSEQMAEVGNDRVALTVTSPPYWNAIEYDTHASDPEAWHRERKEMDYDGYLELLGTIFAENLRVTKPGGYAAIVIGTVLLRGRHTPLPYHLTNLMEKIGWEFHQDIIWHKVTGGVKRAGVFIQHPYPGYYYPNIMTEYILVFRKPGPAIFKGIDSERKERDRRPIDDLFKTEIANNVWHIAPGHR